MERLFTGPIAHRASHFMGRMADIQLPRTLLKPIIDAYAFGMGVSMDEVEEPVGGFKSFSDFFGRRLRSDARPVCDDKDAMVSPSDGNIVGFGDIDAVKSPAFSIKGSRYDLDSLLGREGAGTPFRSGGYMVVYLHPRDYHRVHIPADSQLTGMRHVPGARYPVNEWLDGRVEEIYGKNERVVFHFSLQNGGELALIMVAAFGVGNIKTSYGTVSGNGNNAIAEQDFAQPFSVVRGEELGTFLLGSTVVLVWSRDLVEMDKELVPGPIAMGHRLGRIML